ncbi:MAG: thiamine pyrophosphate-binding protein [Chitinophagales bacterium]|nr:thiamine pyrophosphate-binding protein [Chitinophagales bacterium]
MNGGEIIAKVLEKHGVKFLFTLCGGHVSPIFVAAENVGIKVIDTRHEANAVFAADAVSRLSDTPGVAVVTAGPGVTNTITAIKNAAMAQSPLILLGGAAATILKGRGSLQDIDQLSIMKSICKYNVSVTKVKDLVPTMEKAFYMAQEGVPGPVFVECPIDVLYPEEIVREWYVEKGAGSKPKNLTERAVQWYINYHAKNIFEGKDSIDFNKPVQDPTFPKYDENRLKRAVSMLKQAEKPLLVIGSGAVMSADHIQELSQAVEKLGIPVYLSGMGRGLLGKNSDLQMRHKRREAIKDSDLIILAGVPNDFRLDYGFHIGSRKFISINKSREDLFKNKIPSLSVLGDPQRFLIDLAKEFSGSYSEWMAHLNKRNQKREDNINEQASAPVNIGINPVQLFRKLDPMLGDDAILVVDGGDFVGTSAYTLTPRSPLSWLDPGAYGTLGVGAGFALGAKLLFPEKDVWIIYGDGSAGYSLMEYDTFKKFDLPVISVIGNDACWSQIARDQVEILHSDCAMNLNYSDYQLIAKAFGGDGVRVDTLEAFEKAVETAKKAVKNGTPFVINAIIGKTDFRKGSISV